MTGHRCIGALVTDNSLPDDSRGGIISKVMASQLAKMKVFSNKEQLREWVYSRSRRFIQM